LSGRFVSVMAAELAVVDDDELEVPLASATSLATVPEPPPQPAINAAHSDAQSASETDWRQIVVLYDQLLALNPTPVVALNRAVAVAEIDGAAQGLRLLGDLELPHYHLFHAVRADLLRRLGRNADAAAAYQTAITLCDNAREKEFLQRQCDSLARN